MMPGQAYKVKIKKAGVVTERSGDRQTQQQQQQQKMLLIISTFQNNSP